MTREEKEQEVAEISKIFAEAKCVYLTDFTGINVDTINKLRGEFRENNINYRIVKNTLTRLSIKDLPLDGLLAHLDGPTALAFSFEDALTPGKVISKFNKKTDLMPIKAALIDGEVYDQSMTMKIVSLPTRDELISKMLSTLNSPITGLVRVMNGVLQNLVGVLDAVRVKKESESGEDKHEAKPPESGDAKQKVLEKVETAEVATGDNPQNEPAEEPTVEEKVESVVKDDGDEIDSTDESPVEEKVENGDKEVSAEAETVDEASVEEKEESADEAPVEEKVENDSADVKTEDDASDEVKNNSEEDSEKENNQEK